MSTTVIGLYEDPDAAQKALQALIEAGCRREDVDILGGKQDAGADNVARRLVGHGFEKDEAQQYGAAVERGHVLVSAQIADESAELASEILDEHGALGLEDVAARQQRPQRRIRSASSQANTARSERSIEEETVPVVEEEVEIGKRRFTKGGVRVTTEVTETPVRETVQLHEEQVDVERRKVNRSLSGREAEAAFEEKTLEMSETAETAEVIKEARVVEEVVLSKTEVEREKTVEATARRTDVHVERTDGAAGKKR